MPNKVPLLAWNQTFWHPQNFGIPPKFWAGYATGGTICLALEATSPCDWTGFLNFPSANQTQAAEQSHKLERCLHSMPPEWSWKKRPKSENRPPIAIETVIYRGHVTASPTLLRQAWLSISQTAMTHPDVAGSLNFTVVCKTWCNTGLRANPEKAARNIAY